MQTDSGNPEIHSLVDALQDPDLYDHPVGSFKVIETHISWVLLTGQFAYKMKKPVSFGFLDFSSLELRKKYCDEELRLNRRFAPDLYLAVIPVTGSIELPQPGGKGRPIEYLVKMRQFSQQDLLSHLAGTGCLTPQHIDEMADVIAGHHIEADRTGDDTIFGTGKSISKWVNENFIQIRPLLEDKKLIEELTQLQNWCDREFGKCGQYMDARKHNGFVRECHGDLHLGNMALIDSHVTLFDCIEFNPELRWIDVISEVAFVVMDLQHRGYQALAWRFINRYLQQTGDYDGLSLLRYYLVYRALVRAKVAALRIQQSGEAVAEDSAVWRETTEYLELAQACIGHFRPVMILMHGLSGSGKSTVAVELAGTLGAFQIRSDVERKRLFGLAAMERTESALDQGIYNASATKETYDRLGQLVEKIIEAGYPVIVDAAFLQQARRLHFMRLAKFLDVPFILVDCISPTEILHDRIKQRAQAGMDPSEADISVLGKQQQTRDLLSQEEKQYVMSIDTSRILDVGQLADCVIKRLRRSQSFD